MPTGQATPKPSQVVYYYLQNAADVIPAMSALLTVDHYTTLTAAKDGNGAATWELHITDRRPGAEANPAMAQKTAHLGDVLVWDNTNIFVMRIEAFQSKYTVS